MIYEPKHVEAVRGGVAGWGNVPNGTIVFEDTYPELYVFFKNEKGENILRHIGWRYKEIDRPLDKDRIASFEPDCMYDQHWYMETKEPDEH